MWCRPDGPVEPMYIPGRFRTASRPSRTWIWSAPYELSSVVTHGPSGCSPVPCRPSRVGIDMLRPHSHSCGQSCVQVVGEGQVAPMYSTTPPPTLRSPDSPTRGSNDLRPDTNRLAVVTVAARATPRCRRWTTGSPEPWRYRAPPRRVRPPATHVDGCERPPPDPRWTPSRFRARRPLRPEPCP